MPTPHSPVRLLSSLALVLACAGCDRASEPTALAPAEPAPRWVLVAPVEAVAGETWSLTGAVRSQHEPALAFRIAGEILTREVDAGDRVADAQVLFRLDPRDVTQRRLAAEATVASARAEHENAERERLRLADLLTKRLASEQDHDRAVTAARAAEQRLLAAEAELEQARNAIEYATLKAPRAGVITSLEGEVGQVVAPGQVVARLAEDGAREVEVQVPEERRSSLPTRALARLLGYNRAVTAELREVAGSADPLTRTWRARYRLPTLDPEPGLGTTATLDFERAVAPDEARRRVPIGAILERGDGPLVWRVADGRVQPEPVELLAIRGEHAEIRTAIAPGTLVVALGAQLLQAGQPVRTSPLESSRR